MATRSVNRLLLVVCVALLVGCSTGRDVRGGATVYRALLDDPIPAGINTVESTGQLAGAETGHVMYLRWRTSEAAIESLLVRYDFIPQNCETDYVRGNLTLPPELQDDIVDWFPFNGSEANRCYVTETPRENDWSARVYSVLMYQPVTGYVYYGEIGS